MKQKITELNKALKHLKSLATDRNYVPVGPKGLTSLLSFAEQRLPIEDWLLSKAEQRQPERSSGYQSSIGSAKLLLARAQIR